MLADERRQTPARGPAGREVRTLFALVVEDSEVMQALLSQALTGAGFRVQFAGDVAAAEHCLDGEMPDLLVVDHNLPDRTGLQLVAALRGRPGSAGVSVLMVSAEGHADFLRHALAVGVDEYLFKPFTFDALVSKLELVSRLEPR